MGLLVTRGLGEVGNAAYLSLISATNMETYILLTFSADVAISGPAADYRNWQIDQGLVVTSISVVDNTILLGVGPQLSGLTYTITLPTVGITATDFQAFIGPFLITFLAFNVAPFIVMTRQIDARHIEVIFSEAVNENDAQDPTNYSISDGIETKTATKVSPYVYVLKTSKQLPGVSHTVTATNIRDLSGDEI